MRIAFILPANLCLNGPGNGVRVQAQRQAAALRRLGHEVLELSPWDPPDLGALDVAQFFIGGYGTEGIEVFLELGLRTLVFAPIIDTNEPFWRYRLAARIGSLHPKLRSVPAVLRTQALRSQVVVVRSQHERERVISGLGVDPVSDTPVEVVLNGVDPPEPADPAVARSAYDLPEAYLLHVSRYSDPRKNVAALVRAVGPLGLPLVIAGDPQCADRLERLKQLAAPYSAIRILGHQSQEMLNSLYAGCRVFCLPSTHEGTGLAALEAAAYGAGVVITRNGGPPDYFGSFARYVDPGDVASISNAVRSAWDDPQGEALREHVLTNLSWEASARSLVKAYEVAIERRRR